MFQIPYEVCGTRVYEDTTTAIRVIRNNREPHINDQLQEKSPKPTAWYSYGHKSIDGMRQIRPLIFLREAATVPRRHKDTVIPIASATFTEAPVRVGERLIDVKPEPKESKQPLQVRDQGSFNDDIIAVYLVLLTTDCSASGCEDQGFHGEGETVPHARNLRIGPLTTGEMLRLDPEA